MAKVDVIVPAYNAERTIRPALESLLAQTEPSLRILLVDDGSTDGTREIASALAAADGRIEIIERANGGVVEALRSGLAAVEAPFVARLDADDTSDPERFERQLARFRDVPELVAVAAAHREIDAEGNPTGRLYRPEPIGLADPARVPAREPQIIHSFLMTRTETLRRVGGYRQMVLAEDTDLYWRLMEAGPVEILEDVLGCYRMHAGSLSSQSVANGRILAVSSQFSALSARRRRAGREDIVFPFDRDSANASAGHLARFVERACAGLDQGERTWLKAAVAAKMMELSGYRPFELETADCRFIAHGLRSLPEMSAKDRRELEKMRTATAARMLRLGRAGDARLVAPLRAWPETLARFATGRLYWTKHLA